MNTLFFLHSLWRWVVLAVAVVALFKLAIGLFGKQQWSSLDNLAGMAFTTVFDIQLLLGLIVYAGTFMDLHHLRWYPDVARLSMEHVGIMIVSLVVAHIAWVRVKKADDSNRKFRAGVIGFGISLLMVLVAIPTWAMTATA